MSRTTMFRVMIVLAVLGLGDATYLTIVHYGGLILVCTASHNGASPCETVQTSQYAELAGVPVALLGAIGYVGIISSLLLPEREWTRLATLALTLFGFGFSAYLTYRELFSIHAICEECATSAVFLTLLFIGAAIRYVMTSDTPAGPPPSPPPDSGGAPRQRRATATRA